MTTAHIHNAQTNETIERPLTESELALIEIAAEERKQAEADRLTKEAARAAVLDKLGLTADEAAALLG